MKIIVTGGGTGGHVTPALAVIDALRAQEPGVDLLYVGSHHGIEARLSTDAGIAFRGIATGKLRRSANPLKMINRRNLTDIARVPLGFVQALRIVRSFRPQAVLSTGGYVCVPTVFAAWSCRVPIITHEQTVTVGLANRLAGLVATRIALSFPESRQSLPKPLARKAIVTGNPLRKELFTGSPDHPDRFGFDPADNALPVVYVTGGAQGAHVINQAIADAIGELVRHARVLHQCGNADIDHLRQERTRLEPEDARKWQLRQFIDRDQIGDAWALASLVVSRSGAGTVSEACALGKPAVFIPLEPSAGDEQLKNARRSADAGGAVLVEQAACTGPALLGAILPLLVDEQRRTKMGVANAALAVPDASAAVARRLIDLATKRASR